MPVGREPIRGPLPRTPLLKPLAPYYPFLITHTGLLHSRHTNWSLQSSHTPDLHSLLLVSIQSIQKGLPLPRRHVSDWEDEVPEPSAS